MRRYLLAAVAAVAFATPSVAKDNSGYVGLDAGVLFPRNQSITGAVDFTAPPTGTADIANDDIGRVRWKMGYDVDLRGGYDFGFFRLEAELGYKHAKAKDVRLDDNFVTAFNAGAGTLLTQDDFDLGGHVSVLSGMVNALLDFGGNDSVGGYIGGGAGYARVKEFRDSDSGLAYQVLAGIYAPVSDNIDIGLKYRYFVSNKIHASDDAAFAAGAGPCGPVGAASPCSGGVATFGIDHRFISHSIMASLVYNFAAAAPPPPPPPPAPPPPPPPAPATQTCPDGSVILATDTCPLPPPPPPPPPPAPERGM
jgi:opacity protein-like surface antigen